MQRFKVNYADPAMSFEYYASDAPHETNKGIGNKRYLKRARAVKRIDPGGVYSAYNLGNNTRNNKFTNKESLI